VFLKKMSAAIADGNQILACISSTAVYQNENCTPVFVPNSPSLTYLFKDIIQKARLEPQQISVVEAHGTGTPVGDPAEYEVRSLSSMPSRYFN
jgi:acyl transferase domain-containing protein